MQTVLLTEEHRQRWNQFVSQASPFGLLQSWEWGVFKEKLGWEALRLAVESQGTILAGAQLLIRRFPLNLGSVAYIPNGPVGRWLEADIFSLLLSKIHHLAKTHGALMLKIEPSCQVCQGAEEQLQQAGFQINPTAIQPRATILVDLSPPLEQIYAYVSSDVHTKYRSAVRKGVSLYNGNRQDLECFYEMLVATSKRGGFPVRPFNYYQDQWDTFDSTGQADLMFAIYQSQAIASVIVFHFGNQSTMVHLASLDEHRNLNSNRFLVMSVIQNAKEHGCTSLDLGGIPDEIANEIAAGRPLPTVSRKDGLWGVYHFKRQFSDNVIGFAPACDYSYLPLITRLVNRALDDTSGVERVSGWLDGRYHQRR